jgi:hypothetical protein
VDLNVRGSTAALAESLDDLQPGEARLAQRVTPAPAARQVAVTASYLQVCENPRPTLKDPR